MAEKRATIRLGLNTSGYLASLAAADRKTLAAAKRWERAFSTVSKTFDQFDAKSAASVKKIADAFGQVKLGGRGGGFTATLRDIEAKSTATARKIEAAMNRAFAQPKTGRRLARVGMGFMEGAGLGGAASALSGGGWGIAGGLATGAGKLVSAGVSKIAEITGQASDVFDKANRISISARGAGQNYVDPKALTQEFFEVTQEVKGITADAAADATAKFVSLTGDLDTARKNLNTFATVSSATGAEMGDVADAMAAITTQFKVTDQNQVKEILAALTYQGKAAAFELKDAASQYQRLTASGAAFGITKDVRGVKTLGALTQIAMGGTGKGDVAATAVENILTNLKTKATQLEAQGVKVYEKGKTRDVIDVLVDAISKVGGNDIKLKNAKLTQIFGDQGIRGVNPLISKYQDTRQATQGTEEQKTAAAIKMLRDEFEKTVEAAGTWEDVVSDSSRAQQSASAKFTAAMEGLKAKVADTLIPRLIEFADYLKPETFDQAIDGIGQLADAAIGFAEFLESMGLIKGASAEKAAERYRKQAERDDSRIRGMKEQRDALDPKKDAERIKKLDEEIEKKRKIRDANLGMAETIEKTSNINKAKGFGRYQTENFEPPKGVNLEGATPLAPMAPGADGKLVPAKPRANPYAIPTFAPTGPAALEKSLGQNAAPPPKIDMAKPVDLKISQIVQVQLMNPQDIKVGSGAAF